jgi:hypothetical protein
METWISKDDYMNEDDDTMVYAERERWTEEKCCVHRLSFMMMFMNLL